MTTPFEIELTAFILYRRHSSDEYRFTGVEIGRRAYELLISSCPSHGRLSIHV
jgi:hypothetical protein